jgi:phage-related protein
MLGTAAGELVGALVTGVQALLSTLLEVGQNIVEGVWQGILSRTAKFQTDVMNFFKNIVAAVKKSLGIQSPSTVFFGIGENMALGLGKGFNDAIAGIGRDINDQASGLSKINMSATGAGGLAMAQAAAQPAAVINNTFYNTVAKDLDIDVLAYRVLERIQRG